MTLKNQNGQVLYAALVVLVIVVIVILLVPNR